MNPSNIEAEIVNIERLPAQTFRLSLRAPAVAASARPGQFIMVRINDGSDPLLRRPFSIHRIEKEGTVQILVKVVGKGTAMLSEKRPGQNLGIVGPLGKAFDKPLSDKVYIVGGGIGTAPLFFFDGSVVARGTCNERKPCSAGWREKQGRV